MPKKSSKKEDSKGPAFITAFLSIIGFIIALLAWRKDKYVMFYAKQSLVIFIAAIITSIIGAIVAFIPIIGTLIGIILNIIVAILWILSWVYALSGEEKYVPIIGEYAKKIDL